jgi:flagellar hook-associated protein 3 FlgL
MRITDGVMKRNFLNDYEKIQKKIAKEQIQVASTSRIQTLSDDVNGALQVVSLKAQISKIGTYQKNAGNAGSFITSTLNCLDSITTELQNIKTTAASSDNVLNQENFATMSQSIKDNLNSIVQNLNVKQNNLYLFGGTNCKGDVASIVSGKAVATTEDISGEVKTQISQSLNITMNVPGSKVMNTGIFAAINNIIDTLDAGSAPTDAEKTALNDAYNQIIDIQSSIGTTQNRIEDMTSILNNQSTNYETLLSNIQSVDTAKIATDLQSQETLLQIIEQLIASTSSKTIFDYL